MDFKLFGRLKDGNEGDSNSNSSRSSDGEQSISEVGGGDLKRTVKSMFQQGYDEDQIRSELQGQYDSQNINRAINNVVTSSATGESENGGPEPMSPYKGDDEALSPMDEGYDQENQQQNNQQNQGQNQQQNNQQPIQQNNRQASQNQAQLQSGQNSVDLQIEELIETIIAENFQKVETEFQNAYEELDVMAEKLEELDNRVHDLEVRDDEDQQEFVKKMDEVEDHIDSYESRIGGLEKAFQQILPSLVDNIRDLTGLVQEIKRDQGIETDTNVSSGEVDDIDMDAFKSGG